MASTVLETLRNVELGRQNCIKNAKLANLDATQNMDVFTLGELFLQKNTPEFINPNDEWVRPEDWWDTKTILEEAEDKDGLHPAYILLLSNSYPTTTFTKTTSGKALQGDGYLTSDGSWYTTNGSVHTWDITKDKECSLGYKTRYVIVYVANTTNINKIDLTKFPCLEFIAGNITLKNDGLVFGASGSTNANQNIINIEYTESTIQNTLSTSNFAGYCYSLKRVSFPSLTTISGSSAFNYCYSLTNVSFPSLTTISGGNTFNSCYSLTNVSFPALTTISGTNTFNLCYSLTSVSFPALTKIQGNSAFSACSSLKNISLPALTTISGNSAFSNCYSLTNVSLPSLITISGTYAFSSCSSLASISLPALITISGNYAFNYCYSLISASFPVLITISGLSIFSYCSSLASISLPALTTISLGNTFGDCHSLTSLSLPSTLMTLITDSIVNNCFNLYSLNLFNGFKFSGLNLSTCTSLTHDSLVDILGNLADVTGESSTYTLTLGATNLGKLTSEEIASGTNKGWVIN